jgi:hypothetical protein
VLGKTMELWNSEKSVNMMKYDERYEIYGCPCMSVFLIPLNQPTMILMFAPVASCGLVRAPIYSIYF